MPHRELIATVFRVGALVLGIPSSVAFAFLGFGAVRLHYSGGDPASDSKSGDSLIDLLVSGARIFGKLFEFFGGAVKWVLAALSLASLGCLVFAVLLYFTGRGLQAGRGVARATGILLAILPLLIAFITLTATRRPVPLLISSVTFALAAYVIWALGWRFHT